MQSNAKIGGILAIVAGALGGVGSLMGVLVMILVFSIAATDSIYYNDGYRYADGSFTVFMVIWIVVAVFFILVGALSIVGGIFAIRRKNWGLALAGAIAGIIAFFPVGVPAVIFVAMGKGEFETGSPPASPLQ